MPLQAEIFIVIDTPGRDKWLQDSCMALRKLNHIQGQRPHLKYLVVSFRPRSTGVFWPTDCLMTQLPSATRGMILNAPLRSFVVSSLLLLSSRNLRSHRLI